MTTTEKLSRAERWRVTTGKSGTVESDGFNGSFLVPVNGEYWHVMLSDSTWRTLCVTHAQDRAVPTRELLFRLRQLFFDDDSTVAEFYPPNLGRAQLWEVPVEPPIK